MKKRILIFLCCLSVCTVLSSCEDIKEIKSLDDNVVSEQPENTLEKETDIATESNESDKQWTNNY